MKDGLRQDRGLPRKLVVLQERFARHEMDMEVEMGDPAAGFIIAQIAAQCGMKPVSRIREELETAA